MSARGIAIRCSICVDGSGVLLKPDGRSFVHSQAARDEAAEATAAICAACRHQPANAGWSSKPLGGAPIDEDRQGPIGNRIASAGERRLRPIGDRRRAILQLVTSHTLRSPRRTQGKAARRRPETWESHPLSFAEIAFLVGCSRQFVRKVVSRELERFISVGERRS
jgi:hypothetical protein